MAISESNLPEFEYEMAGTQKVLERIPDDKLDWKVHEKSNTIGWVANHLAEIPGWVEGTQTQDVWDINPEGDQPYAAPAGNYRIVQGRWPGSRAPEFVNVGKHMPIEVGSDRDWPPITLAAWVRIERLDAPYQSLLHTDGRNIENTGQVH